MKKKILTSAENLASLDLLIADKKAGKANFANELYEIIVIIIGEGPRVPIWRTVVDDYPVFSVFDKVSNAVVGAFKQATVEELVQLREGLAEKR
jgi:hypothetical protein